MIDLKQLRKQAKLTQAQAANLCHVSVRAWKYWENGGRTMPDGMMELFLLKADLHPDYFLVATRYLMETELERLRREVARLTAENEALAKRLSYSDSQRQAAVDQNKMLQAALEQYENDNIEIGSVT